MGFRIYEKLAILINLIFIFMHVFHFDMDNDLGIVCILYITLFFVLVLLNYALEGIKVYMFIYLIAHPVLIYAELHDHEHVKGLTLALFTLLSVIGMACLTLMHSSDTCPIKGDYAVGHRDVVLDPQ